MVLENISNIKIIGKKENIETYEGYMKIKFKKLIIKNENELYYYKSILESKKIYDIIKDNNIIYIYYDTNEDLDDILNKNEYKEAKIKEHCGPINKKEILELLKKEDAMCKIESQKIKNGKLENIYGNGLFLKLNNKDIPFKKCLITNNHILDENDIKINEEIKIEYRKKKKILEISKDRKVYTNEELDYTCIEIFDKDEIKEFFNIDKQIIKNSIEIYKDRDIFILQYLKGNEISFSDGIVLGIKDNKIIHNCSTNKGSSGSPIISRYSDNSIIGLHYGSDNKINLSTNINSIINDIIQNIHNNHIYNKKNIYINSLKNKSPNNNKDNFYNNNNNINNLDNTFETEIVKLKSHMVKIDEKRLLTSENEVSPLIEINNIVFNFN